MDRGLILVYNADSGLFSIIKDAFHKTFLPAHTSITYAL